jgi:hypothetical protein
MPLVFAMGDVMLRRLLFGTALGLSFGALPAFADTWVLIVQPAPYSKNPPPYAQWQPLQQFASQNQCIDARMGLHYQYWDSDRDLSMRALSGVCRNEATGQIATDYDSNAPDDDF